MCQSHVNTQTSSRSSGGAALAERPPRSGRGGRSRPNANREKLKKDAAKAAPIVPGITASLANASVPALGQSDIPKLSTPPKSEAAPKTDKPKALVVDQEEKSKTVVAPVTEPKKVSPAKGDVLDLIKEKVTKEKAPSADTAPTKDSIGQAARENPISSVEDLLTRGHILAKDIIPKDHLASESKSLSNITKLNRDLLSYECERSFTSTELKAYQARSLYAVNLLLFPEDKVRYSSLTNFVSDIKSKFKANAVKQKAYKKLVKLGLASGQPSLDSAKLPSCFDDYLRF